MSLYSNPLSVLLRIHSPQHAKFLTFLTRQTSTFCWNKLILLGHLGALMDGLWLIELSMQHGQLVMKYEGINENPL